MGILDKLRFWKKEEPAEFALGKYPALEAGPALPGQPLPEGIPGMIPPSGFEGMPGEELGPAPLPPQQVRGQPAPSAFVPVHVQPPSADVSRDMQIVQAKLDTLKALLDSVISKLDRIERVQQPSEEATPLRLAGRSSASSSPGEAWRDVRRWR